MSKRIVVNYACLLSLLLLLALSANGVIGSDKTMNIANAISSIDYPEPESPNVLARTPWLIKNNKTARIKSCCVKPVNKSTLILKNVKQTDKH